MKIMIASDIHGSAYYCEKMLDAYKKEQADRLLLLGDILYHGPRNELPEEYCPKKCIEVLKKYLSKIFPHSSKSKHALVSLSCKLQSLI